MDEIMVDQRTLEYRLKLPVKVIERYTSEAHRKDYIFKRVTTPPLPMVEFGDNTKRFIISDVLVWVKQHFGNAGYDAEKGAA